MNFFGLGILLAMAAGCHRAPGADVVATVNGKEIMRADLEKLYKANLGDNPQEPSPEQADIVRLKTLTDMINDEILQERAAKLNLAASDEDVNAKLTEIKAPYTQEEFDRLLKQRGLTLDDLKRQIRRGLTQTKLLNKEIESKINITDAEISNYYNTHKSEFNLIEPQYHLAQIVVTGNPPQQGPVQSKRTPNEAEAKKEIQSIHNRIESGEDFGTLAAQFSENANSASNDGDMGFIAESQLRGDPEVFNAVNALKVGQVTQPLSVYDNSGPGHKLVGYAIYKLLSREASGQRELKDPRVQQSIRQGLRERQAQLLQNAYYEMLHDDAKIHNYFAEQILKQGAK
ncbi:MAG TPA: peptidylprolyl isomerase [Terracidiphilus sp.]|nr:peptidylprolyl isomerase [Terracidiphilus sp.]